MSKKACNLFKPGNHGSTFGGNPLACATASTVLDVIVRDKLCEKVAHDGLILKDKLMQALGEHPNIVSIRGKGYMLGIELDRPASDVLLKGIANGILLNVTSESVIRLLPPLIMSEAERDELVLRLVKTIHQFVSI